jgi:hypothetical protein
MKTNTEFKIENYQQEKLVINIVWANIFGFILLIPTVLVFGLPYYLIWKGTLLTDISNLLNHPGKLLLFVAATIVGIVIHELIHGVFWARYAKNGFKSIKFGILLKMLTPYCHCKEALKIKHYIIGAIMPAILLGIVPAIIAIAVGNLALLIFGIVFTMAACGDFLVINLLRKEDMEDWVQDHPSEAGCYIYRLIK